MQGNIKNIIFTVRKNKPMKTTPHTDRELLTLALSHVICDNDMEQATVDYEHQNFDDLTVWRPFEGESMEDIQEMVQNLYNTLVKVRGGKPPQEKNG